MLTAKGWHSIRKNRRLTAIRASRTGAGAIRNGYGIKTTLKKQSKKFNYDSLPDGVTVVTNTDAVSTWEITPEGWLQIDMPVSTPGVLVYDEKRGDSFTAREYRSREELSNQDSVNSLIAMPVTIIHPKSGQVDSKNYRATASGVVKHAWWDADADTLFARVLVQNDSDVQLIKRDKSLRGSSLGYACGEKPKIDGQSPWGQYDTVQRAIRYNHLAICRNPRNKNARFNIDSKEGCMDLEEELAQAKADNATLKQQNDSLTAENGQLSSKLLKANNKIINQDSERENEYQRGLADGKSAHIVDAKAKELKINTDGMDPKLVKLAIIKKHNPGLNTDSWNDDQIAAGLEMVMSQKAPLVQTPRQPSGKTNTNNDSETEDGHSDYMSRLLSDGTTKGGKNAD
ncbi:DUF2213 domain-containing protein [Salmonella enterica subsp. enterica serovar Enteritidis]|nr:DUF2213 domain-containing protein [Salmonella enterica subsp. enterica serovar Enteritidis]EHX6809354.1 DUF2213 domain-containing protein [Salmonella enterica subsp. enterica serovar Enteritidis]